MSEESGDPEPFCARCARHQATCCQNTDIYVTRGDVRRIEAGTGRTDFCDYRLARNPAYLGQDDDPLWRRLVFRADGTRRVLRQTSGGDCTFLSSSGCTLPSDIRPVICRLCPFEYTAAGVTGLAPGCPTQLLRPGEDLIGILGMSRERAEELLRALYVELLEEEALQCASV
ncbi:MAG: YkgJ family cysteine cluster protein [Planctomycetota bacterium]